MLFRTFRLSLSLPANMYYEFTLFAITPLPILLYISIKFVHSFVTNRFVVEKKQFKWFIYLFLSYKKNPGHTRFQAFPTMFSINCLPKDIFYVDTVFKLSGIIEAIANLLKINKVTVH